jgi:hypothetical protein
MGNNKELLLVHSGMQHVTVSEDVNVMLTPQFYTLKKEALPLSYSYQAKKIAASLFEGLLEDGRQYDYMVWKEEGEWVFLAYDMQRITAFLEEKGFALEHVSKLFFTQQVVDLFDTPLALGAESALVSMDRTVVLVPRSALREEEDISWSIDKRFTPKKGVLLQGAYGSLLSVKHSVILATVFGLFALMFFVEGWRYSQGSKTGESQIEEMLEAYPSLSSKYTRDSIISKYKTLDARERKKREIIKTLSTMIFKGVTLTDFSMDEKMFKVAFTCEDAQVAKRLKALAKKNRFNISAVSGSNDLTIEGSL